MPCCMKTQVKAGQVYFCERQYYYTVTWNFMRIPRINPKKLRKYGINILKSRTKKIIHDFFPLDKNNKVTSSWTL